MSSKILVVDDEPNLLRLLSYALYSAGYQTLTAERGEEALALIEEEKPDLIVLDIMMPGIDGLTVCQRLRNQPATSDLPIIMLSARSQVPERIEGLEAGADEYVTKPVSPKELVARVGALLNRTQRLRDADKWKRGRVLGFIGAKGGVGTTTVAANVALALARQEESVAAIELRPSYGTFAFQLGRSPSDNLTSLLGLHPEEIEEGALEEEFASHSSGMRVLFGPQSGDVSERLTFDRAQAIVKGAAALASYTILDLPPYPTAANRAALRQCDEVVLVCESDAASVSAASVMLQLLESWKIDRGRVGIVINRTGAGGGLSSSNIATRLGCWVLATIPAAPSLFQKALRRKQAVILHDPVSPAASALRELAAYFLPEEEE